MGLAEADSMLKMLFAAIIGHMRQDCNLWISSFAGCFAGLQQASVSDCCNCHDHADSIQASICKSR
jgi:hypothetical protein